MQPKKVSRYIDALNPYRYYSPDTSYQFIHFILVFFLILNMADITARPSE